MSLKRCFVFYSLSRDFRHCTGGQCSERLDDPRHPRRSAAILPVNPVSVFQVDGTVDIASPIHNLPVTAANRPLYNCIARVFQAMVPMFDRLHLIRKGVDTPLQVWAPGVSDPVS